ncbi:MAG: hypothetical protein JSS81_09865 [Acidobacteria bacterium]|nr:hypothetical protein [Acidobacteriota bacterium]
MSFISFPAQTTTACSQPKVATLPNDYGSFGSINVSRQVTPNPDANAPLPVSVFLPATATGANRAPVIFFAHGFNGVDYRFYEDLLRQLASRGYAVVFVPYSGTGTNASRYDQLWAGFQKAVQQFGTVLDTTRAGFAGHSYGGGATPELARRGANAGWGANGLFIFTMAAWYNWGTNMEQIPAAAKLVVQVYWDDSFNDPLISQNDVWNRLPQITERKWQVIRSDAGFCSLDATHFTPITSTGDTGSNNTNAQDYWGIWRRLHALADYTFGGSQAARSVAFGTDSQTGRWRSRPKPLAPLEASDTPVVNIANNYVWRWSMRCTAADPGTNCP